MPDNHFQTDIAIIGGGIAGLLLQNRLNKLGYSTLLLEHKALGHGQSSKAQGIIHGGVKYALLGQISEAATAIADQPNIWKSYLTNTKIPTSLLNKSDQNTDQLDLSKTKILSTHHDLWNNGDLKNKLKQMLMQKTLSSQGGAINHSDPEYPELFKNIHFHGSVYKINETVVDMFSLLENLALNTQDHIIKIDTDSLDINTNLINLIEFIKFNQNNKTYTLKAEQYIFASGEQNQNILNLLPNLPKMQLRPLHMVLAKFPEPHILYGHYIGASLLPELTITTHYTKDQQYIWYMGGKIAEDGINLSQEQQITKAQTEIKKIFPWLITKHWQWASFMVNRAEPLQANNKRPDHAFFTHTNNTIVGWPVKMALAPMLADKIINYLNQINFKPGYKKINIKDYNLQTANIAQPVWEELFK